MKKSILLTAAFLLATGGTAFAAMSALTKPQVMHVFENKTITTIPLITLQGELMKDAFAGYFAKDGTVRGQLATKAENYPQTDKGKWQVKSNGTMCITWAHWNQGKQRCVFVYSLKNAKVIVNQNTKKLETVILDKNIQAGNQLG